MEMGETNGDLMGGNQPFHALYHMGQHKRDGGIASRLREGTEGTVVLVGRWQALTTPLCGFMRLAEGIQMPGIMEVMVPIRFFFVFLVPTYAQSIDPHEVGRSFSTLMANPVSIDFDFVWKEKTFNSCDSFRHSTQVATRLKRGTSYSHPSTTS